MPSPASPTFQRASARTDQLLGMRPITATFLGVPGHDDRWDDLSPEGALAQADFWRELQRAEAAEPEPANPNDALAREVMLDTAASALDELDHQDHLYDLNSISSSFQALSGVFEHAPAATELDWASMARRLEGLDQARLGYQARLEEGLRTGRIVARRQVERALGQGRLHAGADSPLLAVIGRYDRANPALAAELDRSLTGARAAIGALCDWLERTYLPRAPQADAVGPERYRRAARQHLGLTVDPVETYAWGWEEVRRIEAELRQIAGAVLPGASVPETVAHLRADPARCAPDTAAFIALMQERQHIALSQLDGACFDVPPPARRLEVRVAPPGGPIGAYYNGPSEDFSRPGTVWYSLESHTNIPYFAEISTAHHEGFPGHHLHVSTQLYSAERLSRFQRLIAHNTGHLEGWALYAERLMRELGFLELPEHVLGALLCELVRAWRVVVDIGLHLELCVPDDEPWHPGETWTAALATLALRERAFLAPGAAESNVVRYLGWPAQAIAYKVGERVVLDLREELRRRQGESFDMKLFHARMVGVGTVGLDLLRRLTLA